MSSNPQFSPMETEHLQLRSFRTEDAPVFAAYRSDPEVARYQGWDAPFPLEKASQFIEAMIRAQPGIPGEWYQIAIEVKESRRMIGDCAFHVFEEDGQQARIGFTLARKFQGQGYATEAVLCLLSYLFETLKLHRVSAICDAENIASARVLEKVGMRREAAYIENIWFKGAWRSEFEYAILFEEWVKRR
jgi:RimJ/RimL family protein N-acetyltransferase